VSAIAPSAAKRALLIRVAMAVGVATFLIVAWFVSSRRPTTVPPQTLRALTTAMYVAVGAAAAVIMALRIRIAAATAPTRLALAVVAWAVGEFAALFGGVLLFLTGDWTVALPGALVFAMSLVVVRGVDGSNA
jgi:hypothetical protein